jgi:hypothetical protein
MGLEKLNKNIDFLSMLPAPNAIVKNGKAQLGAFNHPVQDLNLHQTKFKSVIPRKYRLKKWHYFSFISSEIIVGLAIADTGYAGNFFFYLFNIHTNEKIEIDFNVFNKKRIAVAENSIDGESFYKSKHHTIRIQNNYNNKEYKISFTLKTKNGIIEGTLSSFVHGDPLVNSREVANNRIVYTHQSAIHKAHGKISTPKNEYLFNKETDFSGMDYTKGYHLYKTTWNWACAAGKSVDEKNAAINFARPLVQNCTNHVYALWIGEKLYRMPPIEFIYDDIMGTWQLKSKEVDIIFKPSGKRQGKMNTGLIRYWFVQPFGTFSGKINVDNNEFSIDKLVGVTEEHVAFW